MLFRSDQVAGMVKRILKLSDEVLDQKLDATDAVAAALCHFYQSNRPTQDKSYSNWKDFISKNPNRIK